MAAWHLRRMYHTEGGFLCVRPTDLKSTIDKNYENLQTADRQAIVSLTDSEGPDTLAKFSRYKARLERSMYRALHELQRRREKAEKNGLQVNRQSVPCVIIPVPDYHSSEVDALEPPQAGHAEAVQCYRFPQ